MNVVVLGASGKLGRRLVASCLEENYDVTAAVRNPDQFRQSLGSTPGSRLRVVRFDATESNTLDAALAGHDAAISAAGNVADGARFVDLFDRVVSAAQRTFSCEQRIWMLAGAAILDIPHTRRIGLNLPFVPRLYRPHLANWRRLQRSTLDWALACPGAMVAGDDPLEADALTVSIDTLPYPVGPWARIAPPIALSLLMKSRLPRLNVPYRGVADVIANNLSPGGCFSRRRVGIGWADPNQLRATDGSVT